MEARIIMILSDFLKEEREAISLDDNLMGDLGFSSLDMLEIVTTFEEEFALTIPDQDIADFVVVRDLLDYLQKNETV